MHRNAHALGTDPSALMLRDYAFAAASNSKGIVTLAVNANISYFKSSAGQKITAEAKEISSGNKLCNYNVDIFDENKDLIAQFIGMGYRKKAVETDYI